ncbi:PQQ-dependent dehydrogenase, methanol/ethanol family [Roseomonas rosea]|uniref:PQQ-dependent dehydrogenase, methanol/ethanol family n=1 Tax=Muricoccus roseus TaxID=198092 RepID=A0A1M6DD10_9PROT|nr:PQQ-binding-like beta-propeller repeat protein [Roseomonas rosea]SHI71035.1 PQQ-dependent dehydrogenase, methanol/ethanol family [Roseomonas rosea]
MRPLLRAGVAVVLMAMVLPMAAPCAQEAARDRITPANVATLRPVLTLRTGSAQPHLAAPVAADGLLFVLTPFPHHLLALDPASPTAPLRWRHVPEADGRAAGQACCGASGGVTAAGNRLFLATLDGRLTALEPATGSVLWDSRAADPGAGETLGAAPLVVGDRLFLGNAGDDFGVRGWIGAWEAPTGRPLWRRYTTGPDSDVGIGPDFRPHHHADQGRDLGQASWPPSAWRQGGGGVTGPILWDPTLGLLFHGTGHAAPWNPARRPGDNKWTAGLFARDPETGMARWFDSISPHDPHALGSATANALVELSWQGRPRRLLIHPDPNGRVYLLDPASGEMLSAEPFAPVNSTTGVDLANGRPQWNGAKLLDANGILREVCPGRPGAVGGEPDFSRDTGLFYIPASLLCMDIEFRDAAYIRGTGYTGANIRLGTAPGAPRGALVAWDVAAARAAWRVEEPFPLGGGALATAGGLVFYGTRDGALKAVDARSGQLLWRFDLGTGAVSRPVGFLGRDGRPYLAILAGDGRGAGREIDPRDASADSGLAHALRGLPPPREAGGVLYVFGLP